MSHRHAALLALVLACHAPTSEPTEVAALPSLVAPEAEPAPEPDPAPKPIQMRAPNFGPLLTRVDDLAASGVEELLAATLGHPVAVVRQIPLAVHQLPYRDVVAFIAEGHDYCLAHTYPAKQRECEPQLSYDGHFSSTAEHFGFAIISFTDPAAPSLEGLRFIEPNRGFTESEPPGFAFDSPAEAFSDERDITLGHLESRDLDGDGRQEIIADMAAEEFSVVEYYYIEECDHRDCSNPDEFARTAYSRSRILILRDDLTVQFDLVYGQFGYTVFAGNNPTRNDQVDGSYSIEPNAILAQWCELDPMVDYTDCERQAECASEHLRWAYDQASDSYPNSETLPPTPAQRSQAQCDPDTPAE